MGAGSGLVWLRNNAEARICNINVRLNKAKKASLSLVGYEEVVDGKGRPGYIKVMPAARVRGTNIYLIAKDLDTALETALILHRTGE